MTDISKFKSIGIDVETFKKLKVICEAERRNVRQQIGLMVDKEYPKYDKKDNVTNLGLGTLDRTHP